MGKYGGRLILALAALSLLVAAPLASAQRGGDDDDDGPRTSDRSDRGSGNDGTRWALVGENGRILQQSGGLRTVNCYQANANCYINVGEDARNKGLGATIAGQNNVSGQPPSLTGEIGVGACGIAQLNCAPPGTERNDVIVVSPRNSDGSETTQANRKRFYVEVLTTPAR